MLHKSALRNVCELCGGGGGVGRRFAIFVLRNLRTPSKRCYSTIYGPSLLHEDIFSSVSVVVEEKGYGELKIQTFIARSQSFTEDQENIQKF